MIHDLILAENNVQKLFDACVANNLVVPGKSENQLSQEVCQLAHEMFGVKKYWHKRIVRAGANTLLPYAENPPDRIIQKDDMVFFDMGPVFQEWEADLGRTFVVGSDPHKRKLAVDVAHAWQLGAAYFRANADVTGAELYQYVCSLAHEHGYTYPQHHCGHLIGAFPHERNEGDDDMQYLRADNQKPLRRLGVDAKPLRWILEIHFADSARGYGAFEEALLLEQDELAPLRVG